MKPLNDYRRLAGLTNPNARESWRLEEEARVGGKAEVAPETGIESGKVGRVLTVDGGWAQMMTAKRELFWVPTNHLTMLEALEEQTKSPFLGNLRELAKKNTDFRRVVFTGEHLQFTVMAIPPGGDIGEETHEAVEQVFFCVSGQGKTVLNGKAKTFGEGDVLVVPPGTKHNLMNTGDEALKFYTSYSPPNHLPTVVHKTKADAQADVEDEKFGQKVAKEKR